MDGKSRGVLKCGNLSHRQNSTIFWLLFCITITISTLQQESNSLSVDEVCQNCQRVLYFGYQHYRTQATKRFLRHKLKHLCNRYSDYRRHCMTSILPKLELVWGDMEAVRTTMTNSLPPTEFSSNNNNDDRRYKPIKTCQQLKECDKDQSPIEFSRNLTKSLTNNDGDDNNGPRAIISDPKLRGTGEEYEAPDYVL